MKEKRINEAESLALITEMIRKTKHEPSMKQDYDEFLLYGYTATAISVVVWALIHFTARGEFAFGWFAMYLPMLWKAATCKGRKREVITYLGSMIDNIWRVIGSMFALTVVALVAIGAAIGRIDFTLMLPLSLIYAGIGTAMTGLVIKEKGFVWTSLVGLAIAVYMLQAPGYQDWWNLLFGVSFLIIMVIPAHIARHKIARS